MSEYIERETLLKHAIALNNPNELGENVVPVSDIEGFPAADVETVRHGKWKAKPNIYGVVYCSECGYELHTNDTHYCPNCGANMMEGNK